MLYSIITRNKMVRKRHTRLLTINWGALMILISGSILLFRTDVLKSDQRNGHGVQFCRTYDLRLRLSGRIDWTEFLYSEKEHDSRRSGEKQFDYEPSYRK